MALIEMWPEHTNYTDTDIYINGYDPPVGQKMGTGVSPRKAIFSKAASQPRRCALHDHSFSMSNWYCTLRSWDMILGFCIQYEYKDTNAIFLLTHLWTFFARPPAHCCLATEGQEIRYGSAYERKRSLRAILFVSVVVGFPSLFTIRPLGFFDEITNNIDQQERKAIKS